MHDQDLENKITDTAFGVLEFAFWGLLNHGWSIADCLFKIASWTFVVGAIEALYQKTDIPELQIIAQILFILLMLGIATTVMNVMIYCHNRAEEKFEPQLPTGWYIAIMAVVSLGLIWLGLYLILPAIVSSATKVLSVISAR